MRALSLAATAMLPLLAACGTDPGAGTLSIEPAITVRAGDMFVERPGYQSVSLSAIEVTAGECHVNTVAVNVTMVAIP